MWIDGEMKCSHGYGTCKKQSTSFFAVKYIQVGGGVAPNGKQVEQLVGSLTLD